MLSCLGRLERSVRRGCCINIYLMCVIRSGCCRSGIDYFYRVLFRFIMMWFR